MICRVIVGWWPESNTSTASRPITAMMLLLTIGLSRFSKKP